MHSKYYIPNIEEFHVGFEFEGFNTASNYPKKDEWVQFELGLGLGEQWNNIEDYINNSQVRVKYLDKADIEELGFEITNIFDDLPYRVPLGNIFRYKDYCLTRKMNSGAMIISADDKIRTALKPGVFHQRILFEGIIKNKSELKQVLKMLGINA